MINQKNGAINSDNDVISSENSVISPEYGGIKSTEAQIMYRIQLSPGLNGVRIAERIKKAFGNQCQKLFLIAYSGLYPFSDFGHIRSLWINDF